MQVKTYYSTDAGAPSLTGLAGSLIDVLNACLVDGYGAKVVATITRSGQTATATSTAHGYRENQVLSQSGAEQAEYNGEFKIFNVTADQYDFTVAGTPATPATGTISAKVAPAGWTRPFTGTNKAVYQSGAGSNGFSYRVFDSSAGTYTTQCAEVRGYESMTDVDTGAGPFPTVGQAAAAYWHKSTSVSGTARQWAVIADAAGAYVLLDLAAGSSYGGSAYFIGDAIPYAPGDAHASILTFNPTSTANGTDQGLSKGATDGRYALARNYGAIAGAVLGRANPVSAFGINGSAWGKNSAIPYPCPIDNGLWMTPAYIQESANGYPRAELPGFRAPMHSLPISIASYGWTEVSGIGGRDYFVHQPASGGPSPMQYLIDITGPWR